MAFPSSFYQKEGESADYSSPFETPPPTSWKSALLFTLQ
jgi:hypothetical protein